MKAKNCSREKDILQRIKKGILDPETEKHIQECKSCRETAKVSQWLNTFSDVSKTAQLKKKRLPDPETLWEMAQKVSRSREEALKRALLPLKLSRLLAAVIGLGITSWLIFPRFFVSLGLSPQSGSESFRSSFLEGIRLFFTLNPVGMLSIAIILLWIVFSQIKKIPIRLPGKYRTQS
ncbi:hypothetical protein ACFLT9_01270 [Acidobacteriota bacterium]